jgi:(2Fe-2S) ferredoxin
MAPAQSAIPIADVVKKRRIGQYRRHILFCPGDKCCDADVGQKTWTQLKDRLAARDPAGTVYRSKVGCLRICQDGPIAVVYPEGVWLRRVTADRIENLVTFAVTGDEREIVDLVIARNSLPGS